MTDTEDYYTMLCLMRDRAALPHRNYLFVRNAVAVHRHINIAEWLQERMSVSETNPATAG